MLPLPSASGMFQDQMRSRLGFGPSSPSPANSPMGPYSGGSSTGSVIPKIMNNQGQLGLPHTPGGGVAGPRQTPFGSAGAGSDSTYHPPLLGTPPNHTGPVAANGPMGPYGGSSSTGPTNEHTPIHSVGSGNILGGWNLGGSFGQPATPTPFLNFDSTNKPVPAGQSFDYGAAANTALNGRMDNPYGGFGQSQERAPGYFGGIYQANGTNGMSNGNGSGMSFIPQGGMYGGAPGQAPQMMPDQFANMNYNLPVYGNVAPYPGA